LRHFFQRLNFFSQWRNQAAAVRHYFVVYGGFPALLRSPYLLIAIIASSVCFWLAPKPAAGHLFGASDIAISVLPNLLGFAVGALAIVLAFSTAEIFEALAERGDPQSFFITLTANLVHFIFVQVITLTVAMMAKLINSMTLDVVTMFLLFYAVLVILSAAIQLFETAIIYNMNASISKGKNGEENNQ
jgi:hypothetical protein